MKQMQATLLPEIQAFLACPTPAAWLQSAQQQLPLLLIDHAHYEKKAAASALHLIHLYPQQTELLQLMSRLAREELRHFEQVLAILAARKIPFRNISAAPYANELIAKQQSQEPQRLQDRLIIGALIEARSCERFAALVPYLDTHLAHFYQRLVQAEGRHFMDYLQCAKNLSSSSHFEARVAFFVAKEAELITQNDTKFRFHSGIPLDNSTQSPSHQASYTHQP